MHEILKHKYGKKEIKQLGNETIVIIKSTKEFDSKEFTEYIENIKMWAREFLNVVIPEPNQIPDEDLIKWAP